MSFRVGESQRRQRSHWICATMSGDLTYSLTQQMWIAEISLPLDNCFLPSIGMMPMSLSQLTHRLGRKQLGFAKGNSLRGVIGTIYWLGAVSSNSCVCIYQAGRRVISVSSHLAPSDKVNACTVFPKRFP